MITNTSLQDLPSSSKNTPVVLSQESLELHLRVLAEQEELDRYFELAMRARSEGLPLSLSSRLFLIFVAWKSGRLHDLEHDRESQPGLAASKEHDIDQKFFQAHQKRILGEVDEGFRILEELASECEEWIIHYRFAAEAASFYEVNKAATLIQKLIPRLPPWARTVLTFNLAVIALNKGQMGLYSALEKSLTEVNTALAQYFSAWAKAGYFQQFEQNKKSMEMFLEALDIGRNLPHRRTDAPILAFQALQQAVWAGSIKGAREAWSVIDDAAKNKNSLAATRHSLAKAIFELNEGRLADAALRFEVLFENSDWNKDHLHGAEFFLWVLMARKEAQRGRHLVALAINVLGTLGYSQENWLFSIYETYFDWLNGTLTIGQLHRQLLQLADRFEVRGLEKGVRVSLFLLRLTDEDSQVRASAFESVREIPLFQRFGLALLSERQAIPASFRLLRQHLSDEVSQVMLDLHLSRLTEDLQLFIVAMTKLSREKVLAWGALLESGGSPLSLEFGRTLLNKEILIDNENRRVVAIENLETLDGQAHLAELAISLYRHPNGLSKEQAALGIGYSQYDPIQHDPIVYNLISRLRAWLRKQGCSVSISIGRWGWSFTHRELIQGYFLEESPMVTTSLGPPLERATRDLPPRLEWIMASMEKKGFLERRELLARFPIQKSTAANDFNQLIKMNLIVRQGQGRGIYYVLKESK